MEEIRRFNFERGRSAERLDRFLADNLPELTRSQVKKLIDDGRVLLDGALARAGEKLKGGESLSITLPETVPAEAQPEAIPLRVLYEDRHLIVIDKPAGMVVHPAPGHQGGTLVNALLHHCQDLAGIGGELRPGIVHRLDKDTSGVMVAAKDDLTLNALARQFKAHSINRRYLALVHGLLSTDRGTVDKPIGRHTTERKKMSGKTRSGRRAVTHWRVLRRFDQDRLTLVELTLETGRTHQIRVHFSETNHPVVGDPVYGASGRTQTLTDPELRQRLLSLHRQALHARILGFIHPATSTYMEFESPLPEDLREILDYLENKYRQEARG
jgi:23S rRNA pseudouridine1911/1915/1917 synthase